MRTSHTHPLHIASVRPAPGMGRIGITFCPGKKQPIAATGAWDRQLSVDLDAIAAWGAVAMITLVEQDELAALQVSELGTEVEARHMDWLHLPLRDGDVPGPAFEESWARCGESVRRRIRSGFDIVVHCKGGLGRAGTVVAKLLVELGVPVEDAIARVRTARPGAIETAGELAYVKAQTPIAERQPATNVVAIRDRAIGSLLGLAIGDAIGTTLEFTERDSRPLLTDMVGGGPFRLSVGEWTDDTAMALALADSLAVAGSLDEADLMQRFVSWYRKGAYSCTGSCFDIGIATRQALARFEKTGDPFAGSADPQNGGNGSLMRLAPVAIRHHRNRPLLRDVAARQSRVTHAADEPVEACVAYSELLADAIEGAPVSEILKGRNDFPGRVGNVMAGRWRGAHRDAIESTGYVIHALEASLWSVGASGDYRGAVLRAANLGHDADTTAAIAGQLAGAIDGAQALPARWRSNLAWEPKIRAMADAIFPDD